jgi:putative ABC transport system substrate-binding protein
MISRRDLLTSCTAVLATPLAAGAQRAAKIARIGYLVTGSLESPETPAALEASPQGLRERGYVEGQNIVIEYRVADGKIELFPGLATGSGARGPRLDLTLRDLSGAPRLS